MTLLAAGCDSTIRFRIADPASLEIVSSGPYRSIDAGGPQLDAEV